MRKILSIFLVLMVAAPLWAERPKKVIYKTSRTAKFDWKWPYHPIERFNAVQTKPYYYAGRVVYLSQEDLAKFRHYFPEKTCHREWGYFFAPGTKLCPKHPTIIFGAPKSYTETIYLQK